MDMVMKKYSVVFVALIMIAFLGVIHVAQAMVHMSPTMMREHMAVFDLVRIEDATHISMQSGDGTDPATWGGDSPVAGARVLVAPVHVVTVDAVVPHPLMTLRVESGLRFATHANTGLTVDTFVSGEDSVFEMGSGAAPIADGFTARIIINDYNGGIETLDGSSPDYVNHPGFSGAVSL